MIDRYLLRYFLAVIDQGNFSRAAQQCRVSQPTLSVGIAKLETLLTQTLFNRSNRRVELTAAGTQFAIHARRIEAEFALAEHELRETTPRKLIRIGIAPTLPPGWVEAALTAVCQAGTSDRLEIVEGRARDLRLQLDRGRIDAALGPIGEERDTADVLVEENYALALSADHALAHHDSLSAEAVAGEPMIVRRHCEALADVSRFFIRRGVRPFMAARTTSEDRALAYVRAGLGITVMPRSFAGPGITMPALAGFAARRSIGFRFDAASADRLRDSESYAIFAHALRAGDRGVANDVLAPTSAAERDVTPAFHPAATRDRPVLSRMSAGEATGGVNSARCCSSPAANAAGVA